MKKEYISPELLVIKFDTAAMMNTLPAHSGETATPGETLAPGQYNDDEEDEEDWDDAPRRGRRGY